MTSLVERFFCFQIDDELRYLELLKLRIGEAELNQCEVMLKDVKDSQRVDSFVNSQPSMKVRSDTDNRLFCGFEARGRSFF